MKILFLSDDFPPKSFGGAGIITSILARGIKDARHDVYVITTIQNKQEREGWRDFNGVKVYDMYVDYYQKLASYISLYNPQALKKLEKIIQEISPDIIHVHNVHNYLSYHSLKIARKYTEKVFLTTHDAMAFNYGKFINFFDKDNLSVQTKFSYKIGFWQNLKTARKRYNPFRNILIRRCLNKYPRKIFAISNKLKEALNQNGIKNIETIHYGIDCNGWEVSEIERVDFMKSLRLIGKKVILFGGRLSEAKGGKIMIEVLSMLDKTNNDIRLLIAGTPNDYSRYLLQYAKELSIEKNVLFTGWLSRDDMRKAYAACNVCVTPSIYFDAFNLFNIEAGAAFRPVVGTCFGGTPEIVVDNITGRIINPYNKKMFCDALLSILGDNNYAQKLGRAGNERIRKYFNLDRYVAETLSEYSK
jgi:glycosyltransferase involved in cell wall biosynthesis